MYIYIYIYISIYLSIYIYALAGQPNCKKTLVKWSNWSNKLWLVNCVGVACGVSRQKALLVWILVFGV